MKLVFRKKHCCYFIRRADQLIQEDKDDVIPYCIAIGDVKKLVHFFMSRGQLKEALLVAQVKTRNLHGLHSFVGASLGGGGRVHVIDKVLGALASAHILAFFPGHFHHPAFALITLSFF